MNTKEAFPAALQKFALTPHFYPESAYNYVRQTYQCLSHRATLKKWYSAVNETPEYQQQAIEAVKLKAEEIRGK